MADRQGIEIDYCPQCRGVWLDRGELDKIIERGSAANGAYQTQPQLQQSQPNWGQSQFYPQTQPFYHHDDDDDKHYYHSGNGYGYPNQPYKRRKREGFLGEIFDFD
jgi:Zn-finger nucleic acid-binding protein